MAKDENSAELRRMRLERMVTISRHTWKEAMNEALHHRHDIDIEMCAARFNAPDSNCMSDRVSETANLQTN